MSGETVVLKRIQINNKSNVQKETLNSKDKPNHFCNKLTGLDSDSTVLHLQIQSASEMIRALNQTNEDIILKCYILTSLLTSYSLYK